MRRSQNSESGSRSTGVESMLLHHIKKRKYTQEAVRTDSCKVDALNPKDVDKLRASEVALVKHLASSKNPFAFVPYPFDPDEVALQFDEFVDFVGRAGALEVKKLLLPMLLKLGQKMLQSGVATEDVQRVVGDRMPDAKSSGDPCTLTREEIAVVSVPLLKAKLAGSALESRLVYLNPKTHKAVTDYLEEGSPHHILEVLSDVKFVVTTAKKSETKRRNSDETAEDSAEIRAKQPEDDRERAAGQGPGPGPGPRRRGEDSSWGRFFRTPEEEEEAQLPSGGVQDAYAGFCDALADLDVNPPVTLPSVKLFAARNCFQGLSSASISPDHRYAALGFENSTVEVWSLLEDVCMTKAPSNLTRLRLMQDAGREEAPFRRIVFDSPTTDDDPRADTTPPAILRRITAEPERGADDKLRQRLVGHGGPVHGTAFVPSLHPDGEADHENSVAGYLLSCSEDTTVKLWCLDTCRDIVPYRGHLMPVFCVKAAKSGAFFISGSMDNNCLLWTHRKSHPLRSFVSHKQGVTSLAIHPNEQYVFTGSADRDIRMWSVQSGATVRLLAGSKGAVFALQVSPDGRLLVSAGEDRRLRLWDLRTGKEARAYRGHSDTVYAVDVSADGRFLLSGGMDGTVRVWDASGSYYAARKAIVSGDDFSAPPEMEVSEAMIGNFQTACSCILTVEWTVPGLATAIGNYCDK